MPSTESFPSDIRSTLDLCLYLFRVNRLYGAICNRIVSYYITEIEFSGKGDRVEQNSLRKLLIETLGVFTKMQQAGVEWSIYGNAFVRCVEPFDRWLVDTRDGKYRVVSLDVFPEETITYDYKTMKYTVPDLVAFKKLPAGKRNIITAPKIALDFRDKASAAPERFSIVFLDPRYVELDKAHQSDDIEYIYRIPPDMDSRIKAGHLHEVNNTPRGLLEAVAKNKDYRFHRGEIYHFRGPTPTGVSDSGWAVPEVLMHYDSLYQLQVYRKADFAVAQDFLMPMRVFTPNFSDKMGDSVMHMLMSQWKNQMAAMIATRRKDPTAIHALPFAANMQEYGGNGKQMVLHDVVEAYTDSLFDGLGFPRELFRGSMQVNQLPNSVRMFERHYEWLYRALDGMLKFISKTVQRAFDADELELGLKRPSMAYSAEWMQLKLQLAANREIPRSDVYPDVGVQDPTESASRAIMEDQDIQRAAAELAADFEKERTQGSMADIAIMQAEQGMAAAQGGGGSAAPSGAGGGLDYSVDVNADPTMVQQRAQEIAATWIQMHAEQPNSHRKEMQMAQATNPTLYAAAKQAMEQMRSQGESAGRAGTAQMLAEGGP